MRSKFKNTRTLGAMVIALSMIAPYASAASAPRPISTLATVPAAEVGGNLIQIDHRPGHWYGPRRDRATDGQGDIFRWAQPREDRRGAVNERDRWAERDGDRWRDTERHQPRYKKGHRGHPEYRRGYKRDNDGWWYPLAAFALGAVILNQQIRPTAPRQPQGNWSHIPAGNLAAHDNWCDAQYRSYSRWDKTFQPYNGPRRYCNSPYDLI